jgi:hypothetical protein
VFELLVARLFFDEIIEPPVVDDAIFKFKNNDDYYKLIEN